MCPYKPKTCKVCGCKIDKSNRCEECNLCKKDCKCETKEDCKNCSCKCK